MKLTIKSLELLKKIMADDFFKESNGEAGMLPDLTEEEKGNFTDLKRKGILTATVEDDEELEGRFGREQDRITWVSLTENGREICKDIK